MKQTARHTTQSVGVEKSGRENLFARRKTRTLSVTGEGEFEVDPDIVNLSFRVSETARDISSALDAALAKAEKVRKLAQKYGFPNENIRSDAVRIEEFVTEAGEEVYNDEDGKKKKRKKVSSVAVIIILRVHLEGAAVASFNNLMIDTLQLSVESACPPSYSVSTLMELRQEARKAAIENAKAKAQLIFDGMEDPTVSLGAPISIEDISVSTRDDAFTHFPFSYLYSFSTPAKGVFALPSREQPPHPLKKARLEELQRVVGDLFVIPKISIIAHIHAVFEIKNMVKHK